MESVTNIEINNLQDIAIRIIECPERMYDAEQAAGILSSRATVAISPTDFLSFRKNYLSGRIDSDSLPVPVIQPPNPDLVPRSLMELTAFAQTDTLGIRNGILNMAYKEYRDATQGGEQKDALKALKLVLEITESIDKKVNAISGKDPAAAAMASEAFQNFKQNLVDIAEEHPEWDLMGELRKKIKSQSGEVINVTPGS